MIAAERRYIAAASITPLLEKGDQLASLPAAPEPDNRITRLHHQAGRDQILAVQRVVLFRVFTRVSTRPSGVLQPLILVVA